MTENAKKLAIRIGGGLVVLVAAGFQLGLKKLLFKSGVAAVAVGAAAVSGGDSAAASEAPADSAVVAEAPAVQQGAPAQALAPADSARDRAARPDSAASDAPVISREAFTYDGAGRRDPFYPLIMTNELRPAIQDLMLTSVLFDPTGRRSIAVMRDRTADVQYRVTTGMLLGRMRVTDIRPKVVYFSIQEFGSNRRDSLVLVDTTKVRSR